MLKREYLKMALDGKRYLERAWLLSVHGILPATTQLKTEELVKLKTVHHRLYVDVNGSWEEIDDYVENEPLFPIFERVIIDAGWLKCVKETQLTSYGLITLNAILVEYPYEGKIPYQNKKMVGKDFDKLAAAMFSDPSHDILEHHKYENAISMLMCLSQTGVPSATKKVILPNKELQSYKEKLLEEYDGRLHDAAAVAEMQNKLSVMNEQYLKDDPAERFYISAKSRGALLTVMGMVGGEQDFIDESKINVMTRSLHEGWTIDDIPAMANSIRAGSFNRGANTALGGYEVKIIARIFQNYTIFMGDCQTKMGASVKISAVNADVFSGRYFVNGLAVDTNDLKTKIGKIVYIRSPGYCNSEGFTICSKCMGDTISNSTVRIPALMTGAIGSFLSLFLSLMHGQSLKTERYNYKERIT